MKKTCIVAVLVMLISLSLGGCGKSVSSSVPESAKQTETIQETKAEQIQTQINTAKEGDLFIAGSADELKPVSDVVSASRDLVKHIPVLAVKSGNPLKITKLADLANKDVRLVLGDAKSTPIGKISDKALTDAGVLDKVRAHSGKFLHWI